MDWSNIIKYPHNAGGWQGSDLFWDHRRDIETNNWKQELPSKSSEHALPPWRGRRGGCPAFPMHPHQGLACRRSLVEKTRDAQRADARHPGRTTCGARGGRFGLTKWDANSSHARWKGIRSADLGKSHQWRKIVGDQYLTMWLCVHLSSDHASKWEQVWFAKEIGLPRVYAVYVPASRCAEGMIGRLACVLVFARCILCKNWTERFIHSFIHSLIPFHFISFFFVYFLFFI